MKKPTPTPTPCVVTKYVDGKPAAQEVVVRPVLPNLNNKKEPERFVRRLRVMAEQETGEEMFVSYAQTLAEADLIIAQHTVAHPEHRSVWFERL